MFCLFSDQSQVWILGGYRGHDAPVCDIDVLSLGSGTVSTSDYPLPEPVYRHSVTLDRETWTLYLSGGVVKGGEVTAGVWGLQLSSPSPSWHRLPSLQTARWGHISFILARRLHVAAGWAGRRGLASMVSLEADRWIPHPDLPQDFDGFNTTCSVVDSTVYISSLYGHLASWQPGQPWQILPRCPVKHGRGAMCSDHISRLYLVSGLGSTSVSMYDTTTRTWSRLTDQLKVWRINTGCVFDGVRQQIVLPGGAGKDEGDEWKEQDSIVTYNVQTGETNILPATLHNKVWGCAVILV